MSENETIKTKKVRSIKSFFSAPKKIKLEVNDFDSPSADVINSKTTNVNKNIHHSTEMMVEQNKTNTEFSKAFKYNTNEQLNQELEKSNYSSSSSTCSSVDLCSSSYESDDEIDKSVITNCETELEFIVKPQSLRTIPGPYDISQTIDEEPYQPNLKNFPKTTYGTGRTKRTRSFQFCWYEQFKWIEYSQSENAVYCFPCRFFSLKQKNDTENMFISTGYTNWKNAMSSRGFLRHDNSDEHKNCTISWIEFKKNKLNKTSVLSQLNNHHASIVTENKKYMEAIIISLRMLAIQGIAFRGHIENESSINQGNFLELMKVISLFDNVVKKKMNGPKNARYFHHSIQKELIHIMASMIINKISSDLEKSMYFAIMIDETKDITKTEQLSVVVRYYYNNEIKERFLGFTPLKNLDANALFNHIQVKLNKCKIDINKCVAQTYDGANVMRGSINGVQALFKNKVPHAFYIHCHNHRLNLVLVDVAKNVDEVNFFFNFLQDLYNFISGSSIHSKFIELQKQIFKIPKPIELKRLCLTRWSSQIHTCRAVKATLEVILLFLYKISNEKSIRFSEAIGLLKNIDFKFIYLLLFFNDLLSQINLLTKYLQDKNADMAKAIILMNSLKEHFCEIRNDLNYHSKLYSETKLIANKLNIKHPSAHNREKNRVKKLPKHLQKYIVEGNSLESSVLSSETDFRNNLYLIIIDKINAELNKRFSNNEDLLMGISVLDPSNSNFLNKKFIHPFALSYMCDIDTLDSELNIIRKSLKQFEAKYHSIKTIFQFHKFLLDYQLAFFELYKLCTIAITIPVSSAACERTFSCMKRIKSYLRNSMLHDNLSSLSIIAIEKSEAKLLNIDDIINNFTECHNNRRIILK
ncbi:hypothetical protein QTP88_011532 [Uroleucon formosanum]